MFLSTATALDIKQLPRAVSLALRHATHTRLNTPIRIDALQFYVTPSYSPADLELLPAYLSDYLAHLSVANPNLSLTLHDMQGGDGGDMDDIGERMVGAVVDGVLTRDSNGRVFQATRHALQLNLFYSHSNPDSTATSTPYSVEEQDHANAVSKCIAFKLMTSSSSQALKRVGRWPDELGQQRLNHHHQQQQQQEPPMGEWTRQVLKKLNPDYAIAQSNTQPSPPSSSDIQHLLTHADTNQHPSHIHIMGSSTAATALIPQLNTHFPQTPLTGLVGSNTLFLTGAHQMLFHGRTVLASSNAVVGLAFFNHGDLSSGDGRNKSRNRSRTRLEYLGLVGGGPEKGLMSEWMQLDRVQGNIILSLTTPHTTSTTTTTTMGSSTINDQTPTQKLLEFIRQNGLDHDDDKHRDYYLLIDPTPASTKNNKNSPTTGMEMGMGQVLVKKILSGDPARGGYLAVESFDFPLQTGYRVRFVTPTATSSHEQGQVKGLVVSRPVNHLEPQPHSSDGGDAGDMDLAEHRIDYVFANCTPLILPTHPTHQDLESTVKSTETEQVVSEDGFMGAISSSGVITNRYGGADGKVTSRVENVVGVCTSGRF